MTTTPVHPTLLGPMTAGTAAALAAPLGLAAASWAVAIRQMTAMDMGWATSLGRSRTSWSSG